MRTVKFTKEFANKKKGDIFSCSDSLASFLVNRDKVASYFETAKETKTKK